MAFEVWEVPGGQWGEGLDISAAVYQALGRAAATRAMRAFRLPEGSRDLSVPDQGNGRREQVGITVLSNDMALYYRGMHQPRHIGRSGWLNTRYIPDLQILPDDTQEFPVYRTLPSKGFGRLWGVQVQLYRYVRYVEGTPNLNGIAERLLPPD